MSVNTDDKIIVLIKKKIGPKHQRTQENKISKDN